MVPSTSGVNSLPMRSERLPSPPRAPVRCAGQRAFIADGGRGASPAPAPAPRVHRDAGAAREMAGKDSGFGAGQQGRRPCILLFLFLAVNASSEIRNPCGRPWGGRRSACRNEILNQYSEVAQEVWIELAARSSLTALSSRRRLGMLRPWTRTDIRHLRQLLLGGEMIRQEASNSRTSVAGRVFDFESQFLEAVDTKMPSVRCIESMASVISTAGGKLRQFAGHPSSPVVSTNTGRRQLPVNPGYIFHCPNDRKSSRYF